MVDVVIFIHNIYLYLFMICCYWFDNLLEKEIIGDKIYYDEGF